MNYVPQSHISALDKAYEAGRKAAIAGDNANPYAYRMQAALYWEWMRGQREYLFGV